MVKSGTGAGFTTSVTVVECVRLPLVPVMVTVYVPAGVAVVVVTDMVDEPDPVTEVGLKLALAPAGNPLALSPTTPANPPEPVIVAVYEVPPPAVTVCEGGVAAMVKSPTTGAFTTRFTEAVCVVAPLVPVMVSGNVPVGVVASVVTVSVELPEVSDAGTNVPMAPAGRPLTLRVTVPANPPVAVTIVV